MTDTRLDHVGIAVRDLDAGAAAYERLGFTLTPFGRHTGALAPGGPSVPLGTGNRCAMLADGYLEVIAVVDPALPARGIEAVVARREGAYILALECDDARATSGRLAAAGFGARGTQPLERPVETPDGACTARFERVPVPDGEMPEGRVFYIRHLTREVIGQPRHLGHANGAVALGEVILHVADRDEAAARYARFLGIEPQWQAEAQVFTLARGRCVLADEAALAQILPDMPLPPAPAIAGFTVAVADLDKARALLAGNGITTANRDGRILVPPPHRGRLLRFHGWRALNFGRFRDGRRRRGHEILPMDARGRGAPARRGLARAHPRGRQGP